MGKKRRGKPPKSAMVSVKVLGFQANTFYLNVAGVWMYNTILDTNDISTIRGSGMALLFATDALVAHLVSEFGKFDGVAIKKLRSAASECLIEFKLEGEAAYPGLEAQVEETARSFLSEYQKLVEIGDGQKGLNLSHLRFTVSVITRQMVKSLVAAGQGNGDGVSLPALFAAVGAVKAREQYAMGNVVLPANNNANDNGGKVPFSHDNVCKLDGVSPRHTTDNETDVGRSVFDRRVFGRERKRDYHLKILSFVTKDNDARKKALLERMETLEFSHTLGDLCCFGDNDKALRAKLTPAIANKIAIIHLDGNKFGQLLGQLKGLAEFAEFSDTMKAFQADLLLDLLDWMVPEGKTTPQDNDMIALGCSEPFYDRKTTKDGKKIPRIRLETLLWGGDEMAFALPAWRAWEAVAVIEASLRKFALPCKHFVGKKDGNEDFRYPTHSIGLCFANVKTPIRTIRAMADQLAGKCETGDTFDTSTFGFNIGIADSVDIPGADIVGARQAMFSVDGDAKLDFPGNTGGAAEQSDWREWTGRLLGLKKFLPASQVVALLDLAAKKKGGLQEIHTDAGIAEEWRGKLQERLEVLHKSEDAATIFEQLDDKCWKGGEKTLIALSWLRYLEDYVLPVEPRSAILAHDGKAGG